ncbi:hypothetical protein CEXT_311811 [Caerostris extrusa]|uniref:Paired domain-containing protein n=1 Tax=Caerostris extrusa TaxID=172846 RepID=A0AAV4T3C9_CAEEX|nr:hypothetical protein CEXT_311811 [Caerostris extrusa]
MGDLKSNCKNCASSWIKFLLIIGGICQPDASLMDCEKGSTIRRMEAGQTLTGVCEDLKIAKGVISRIWKWFKDTGNVHRQPGEGRKHATTMIAKRNM